MATLKQLQETAGRFEENAKVIEEAERQKLASETQRAALEAQIASLRAEIAATKKANSAVADTHDYDEAATRDAFIDLLPSSGPPGVTRNRVSEVSWWSLGLGDIVGSRDRSLRQSSVTLAPHGTLIFINYP